jgi:hypothetical protein
MSETEVQHSGGPRWNPLVDIEQPLANQPRSPIMALDDDEHDELSPEMCEGPPAEQ